MEKNLRKPVLRTVDALLAGVVIVAIAATGWLDDLDNKVSDWLYQRQGAVSPDIVIVGIDSVTLQKLGSMTSWIRKDISTVITRLNDNPAARPAAIGIDILFNGDNPETAAWDKKFAETAAQYDNIAVASAAIIEDISEENDDPYYPWNKTWTWDAPFPELAVSADTGHIFEPVDADGILRHQLLYINVTERGRLNSFARVLYEKWCQVKGVIPNPTPTTEGNGLYYLPFTAKSYSGNISFVDLLEGNFDAEFFRDKIVLIAPYAAGMGDEFTTALERSSSMFGVDIHANAIQAFQENFFPREASNTLQLTILFVISVMTEIFFRAGKMKHVIAGWLILCAAWLGVCQIFYRQEIILHASWVPLAASLLFIGAVATNYVHVRAEKDEVTATFGRYVDPTIMRQLLEGGTAARDVGGTLRNIAMLFVDIRGFTTMSEQLEPPTVVEILNRYLTLTTDCIRRHHGTLDKFVGDCTMAFWNAPLEQEKPVHLACRAAVDMIKDSEALRAELKQRYGREISFGIGVHWGSAVVGNIGSPFRMDYTAIGDTVNTAARLEANAPGGKILISRVVADILGDCADVTSLGDTVKLKGKASGFEVLELNSLKETE